MDSVLLALCRMGRPCPRASCAIGPRRLAHIHPAKDLDVSALRGTLVIAKDADSKELIGVKVRGYTLAPGSFYDGTARGEESGHYGLLPGAPPPHECPAGLIEALRKKIAERSSLVVSKPGEYDAAAFTKQVIKIEAAGGFAGRDEWRNLGMVCRSQWGDDGLAIWRLAHDGSVTEQVEMREWNSYAPEVQPGHVNIQSIFRLAHSLGIHDTVPRTLEAQFGLATLVPQLTPMIGSGARQVQIMPPEYSEIEVADRFANAYASDLRFIKARASWVYWNGKCWRNDETDYVANLARLHCRDEAALCSSTPGNTLAQARSICSDKTVKAVLRLAAVDQRIASTPGAWDQNPDLLGTPDGVVDLRTGVLRAAQPEDHITKSTAVSPASDCPTWLAFLHRATSGDLEMQKYLQRMSGYALTGSTREHSLHFAFGPGGSGKGTFMNAVSSIMNDYHVVTAIETLTDTKFDRHPAEVAALQGARLVTCSETERGRQWAESRIKQWTGGDQISARFMNQNFFTFTPTFKLLISGNYKPHMRPDTAMCRRFQLIPFRTAIPKSEQDPHLGAKLKNEWPGILGWMIAGALEWQRVGLSPPPIVLDATAAYMEEEAEDCLTAWLHDCCEADPKAETKSGDLYRSFKIFAEQAGEKPPTSTILSKELKNLGYDNCRNSRGRFIVGLRLKLPPVPQ